MTHNLQFLPLEIQTSIAELRALGTPDHALGLLVDRILKASEAKTTSLQMDIVRIEDAITLRLDRLGEKIVADMHTQHGATNSMLLDVRALAQNQEAATIQLRAEFQAFGESVSGHIADVRDRQTELEQRVDAQYQESRRDRTDLRAQSEQTQSAVGDLRARLDTFIARIDTLIGQSIPQEQQQRYLAFLDDLMRERAAGS
jgi:hypothetical protein